MGYWRIAGISIAPTFLFLLLTLSSRLANAESNPPAAAKADDKPASAEEKGDDYYELLKLFVDTLDQVERNYVKDLGRRELVEAAIEGMLAKLDEHTNYVSPKEIERFRTGVENEFPGIGVRLSTEKGKLIVIATLPDTPAHRAGLAAGDVITRIEGVPTENLKLDDAVQRLKGESGTPVSIEVYHPHTARNESITITRELVRVETVRGYRRIKGGAWEYFPDSKAGVAYVRITAFGRHTADELAKVLDQLKSRKLQALVLDLRFNPGGLLSSAVEVADLFVAEGRIVSTSGRNAKEQVWEAQRAGPLEDIPLIVLVNQFSASGSEIVAACLQDHGRAAIVGQRTLGKGSVQNIVELEGGRSALKLTTAGYHRPSGKNIDRHAAGAGANEWGVQPDAGCEVAVSDQNTRKLYAMMIQRETTLPDSPGMSEMPPIEDPQMDKALERLRQQMAAKSAASPAQNKPATAVAPEGSPVKKP